MESRGCKMIGMVGDVGVRGVPGGRAGGRGVDVTVFEAKVMIRGHREPGSGQ